MNRKVDFVSGGLIERLINSLVSPAFMVGLDLKVSYSSLAADAITRAATGCPIADLVDSRDLARLQEWSAAAITGLSDEVPLTVRLLNGDRNEPWSVTPVTDDFDNTTGFLLQYLPQAAAPSPTTIDGERLDTLIQNELRWKTALLSANQGLWDHDFENDRHYLSESWRKMRGLGRDDPAPETTAAWLLTIHPDDLADVQRQLHMQDSGQTDIVNYAFRQKHAGGHWIWILSRGRVVRRDAGGFPVHIIGTDTDITEIKAVEQERLRLANRLELAMEVAELGQWEFDIDTEHTVWDDRARRMLDLDGNARQPTINWLACIHPDDHDAVTGYTFARLQDRADVAFDYRVLTRDGSERLIRTRAAYVPDPEGSGHYIGVDFDMTADYRKTRALEKARAQLEYESRHDALTGLANRRRLDEVFTAHRDSDAAGQMAAMHFDIDQFKQINDSLGHDAGDLTLRHTAAILRRHMPDDAIVARAGGDEFVALFTQAPADADLARIAQRIIDAMTAPIDYHGTPIKTCLSIGIARAHPRDTAQANLFINADMALYHAKTDGRGTCRFYLPDMRDAAAHRKAMEDALTRAFDLDQIICHYQPQFDARTLALTGLEALVRWDCPVGGLTMPDKFLGVAADMGLIARVDEVVLRRVLRDRAAWLAQGLNVPRVSVNISAQRLRDPGLGAQLQSLDIAPGTVVFELLESVFLDGSDAVVDDNLRTIADLGIEIEIDDFGTGHASIVSLLHIAPRRLKIDRALVQPVVESAKRRALLKTIIRIGKMLDIDVVAEGVETQAHVDLLRQMNCDVLQGYALARPMTAAAAGALMVRP